MAFLQILKGGKRTCRYPGKECSRQELSGRSWAGKEADVAPEGVRNKIDQELPFLSSPFYESYCIPIRPNRNHLYDFLLWESFSGPTFCTRYSTTSSSSLHLLHNQVTRKAGATSDTGSGSHTASGRASWLQRRIRYLQILADYTV